jgi:hypothetical protein
MPLILGHRSRHHLLAENCQQWCFYTSTASTLSPFCTSKASKVSTLLAEDCGLRKTLPPLPPLLPRTSRVCLAPLCLPFGLMRVKEGHERSILRCLLLRGRARCQYVSLGTFVLGKQVK